MRLLYQFIIVTLLLSTVARRFGTTTDSESNDTQSFTAKGSERNSSHNYTSLLHCNITNATEFIASQDCLCVTESTLSSTQPTLDRDTNATNETRSSEPGSSCSECDGSTEQCFCDSEVCRCKCVNSSADGDDKPAESESQTLIDLLPPGYPFNVLLLAPLPDAVHKPAFDQGGAIIPAVQLAAEQINNRSDILQQFEINLQIRDSGCDKVPKTAVGIVTIWRELLRRRNTIVGVIGPACSEESVYVNTFFDRRYPYIPVFYSGTSPQLGESAKEMTNAHGMISSASVLIDALVEIADKEEWNWENIAVFYDGSREFFQHIYNTFVRQVNNSEQFGYSRQISDSRIPLKQITDRDIRIVVVFSGRKPARQVACIAGQSNGKLVFPIRQFIFLERTLENFLEDENAESSFFELTERKTYYCDNKTVMRGLNGSVLLNQALDSVEPDVVTVSNYTVRQVKRQYRERLAQYNAAQNSTFLENIYAYPYYDALWAFAYGWEIAVSSGGSTFEAANYAIRNNVSFQGVSSWIEFRSNRDRQVSNPVRISQVRGSNVMTVALYNQSNMTYPPDVFLSDEFMVVNVLLHPSLIAFGFLSVFFLLTFIINVQVLNVIYRNHPSVKASSQRLNHFIFIGCYLFVMAITSYTVQRIIVPEAVGLTLCNMDAFCSVLGYCLIISTVLAKSWRTYRIFNHPFKHTRFLGDLPLALFIVGCALVSMLSFIPFFVLDPFKKRISYDFDTSLWPPVRTQTTTCRSKAFGYITIPLTFQLFLTLATIFLATLNKSIKYSNFRNTKQIFVFVYLLALTWAIGGILLAIVYLSLQFSMNLVYPLRTALLVVTVILSLTILQLPAYAQTSRTSTLTGDIDHIHPGSLRQSSMRITKQPSI